MSETAMLASVVVVPRERFRPFVASLRSLFATISEETPVVVVDGGAPEPIRNELQALRERRHFEWVQSEQFVLPSRARNNALEHVTTRYVAFCDNDLEYSPGWLDALVENAERTGAVGVSPITLIGPSDPPLIHHAGGTLGLRQDDAGRTVIVEHHRLSGRRLPDAEDDGFSGAPIESQNFEYHCALVRTDALRAVGGQDERLIRDEHLDTALRLMASGGRLTFESEARVMYRAFDPFQDDDWPYFLFRWDRGRSDATARFFSETWGVYEDPELHNRLFLAPHHERAMASSVPRLPHLLNRRPIKRALLRVAERRIERLRQQVPDADPPRTPPKPPPDALAQAGLLLSDESS